MQDDMRRDNAEFGKIGEEIKVLIHPLTIAYVCMYERQKTYFQPNVCKLFDYIFLPLEVAEFFIQLCMHVDQMTLLRTLRLTNATTSVPMSGMYLFNVAINRE